jgi:hypothetical protein
MRMFVALSMALCGARVGHRTGSYECNNGREGANSTGGGEATKVGCERMGQNDRTPDYLFATASRGVCLIKAMKGQNLPDNAR